MLTIDGSLGEGGGQIIRSSLALSLITGKAFRVYNVRAGREQPGLKPQHLMAVKAAAEIGRAQVDGASVGSREFTFVPGEVKTGEYHFSIGTAGATMLVLQTVLPPLMIADEPSVITLEGGTHNKHAPPFDFLQKTFLPLLNRTGPHVSLELERYGFYPPGGGRVHVYIEPRTEPRRLEINERGRIEEVCARALVVKLPESIAGRELSVIGERLNLYEDKLRVESSSNALSPGNVVMIEIRSRHLTEIITSVGERGVRAEQVAERAVTETESYLSTGAPVGQHLADQLLIPIALAGGGSYLTGALSLHTTTNIEIIQRFLDVEIKSTQVSDDVWRIEI
jgi:RNA 3'-terminal phosphate cyclase (ATP)